MAGELGVFQSDLQASAPGSEVGEVGGVWTVLGMVRQAFQLAGGCLAS